LDDRMMKRSDELTRALLLLPNLPTYCHKSKKIKENHLGKTMMHHPA